MDNFAPYVTEYVQSIRHVSGDGNTTIQHGDPGAAERVERARIMSSVPLILASAENDQDPLGAILSALEIDRAAPQSSLAVLTSSSTALSANVVAALTTRGHRAELIFPPNLRVRSVISGNWTRIPASQPDARFPEIALPRTLAPPRRIVIVHEGHASNPLPVELLSRYVHPRLAAAVGFSRTGLGSAADVALPFNVIGTLMSSTISGSQLIAGTSDLIAGQLLALALRTLSAAPNAERIGPWEDPVVQRATELELGLSHPSQLNLTCLSESTDEVAKLFHSVRLLLGIDGKSPRI